MSASTIEFNTNLPSGTLTGPAWVKKRSHIHQEIQYSCDKCDKSFTGQDIAEPSEVIA